MPRYWIIAPVEADPREMFDKVWQFDLANNLISIGWKELDDVSKMGKQELANAVASKYPEKPPGAKGLITNMIWNFYHEIEPGDFVIARRGVKKLAGVGKVIQSAVYSPGKNPLIGYPNFLGVSWQEQPRDKDFEDIIFPRRTLAEVSEAEFQEIVTGPTNNGTRENPEPEDVEDQNAFVLEKHLRDHIVNNFDTIFKGEKKLFQDSEVNGKDEYHTDIGRIDILAVEPKSKSFVVIELKKGRSSDKVIGQVLRYMGWVKMKLCDEEYPDVKGLVICRDLDQKLSYALIMTKDIIQVRYYTQSFKLWESPQQ